MKDDVNIDSYIPQILDMAEKAKRKEINIDYFPTNFIVNNDKLFYIDYEVNDYHDEWNFNNWGIRYWSKTKEFNEYLKTLKKERKQ